MRHLIPLLSVTVALVLMMCAWPVLSQQHARHFKNEGSRSSSSSVQTVEDVTSLSTSAVGGSAFQIPLPLSQEQQTAGMGTGITDADRQAERRRLLDRQRAQLERQYPRDMRGYGEVPPDPMWPGNAKVAVQFVVNYEEGGENNILHGDAASEAFLSEIVGAQALKGVRHYNMESIYEYGSRAGFWRLLRLFKKHNMRFTCYAVATALQKNPDVVEALQREGMEIASHGLKWIDYQYMSEQEEWRQMREAIRVHEEVTGERPRGWYLGRTSPNSVRLAMEEGGFTYIADSYADDLPYWIKPHIVDPRNVSGFSPDHKQLVVPYTLDANDMRFATPQGFNSGEQFFQYLKDTFDTLYEEGMEGAPKMMSVGLHCRLVGRPGRAAALARFLRYIRQFPDVWVPTRLEIAEHWHAYHKDTTTDNNNFLRQMLAAEHQVHQQHHLQLQLGEQDAVDRQQQQQQQQQHQEQVEGAPAVSRDPPRQGNDVQSSTTPLTVDRLGHDSKDDTIVNSLSDFAAPAG